MLFLHQVLDYLNVKNKLSFFPAERTFPTRLQPTFLKSCLATTPSTLISCRKKTEHGGEAEIKTGVVGRGGGLKMISGSHYDSLAHQRRATRVIH